MRKFNQGYSSLFNQEVEEDDEEGEGQEDKSGVPESNNGFGAKWAWVSMIANVSDVTKETWANVLKMDVYSFFNITCYIIDKRQYEKQQIEEWRKKH